MRDSPDMVRRGMLLILLVGLLVGGIQAISLTITNSNPDSIIAASEQFLDEKIQEMSLNATDNDQRKVVQMWVANKHEILALLRAMIELPTPLPRPASTIIKSLGLVGSTPMSYLSRVLLAVIITHLTAKQLGGQGSIQQMLGLGALSVAPHALDALSFIPNIGSTIELIAWSWGLVILIVATSIVHRLDSRRAILAVLLYPVIGMMVAFLISCCAFLFLTITLMV
ncbi:MAG: YIP1 family protein [Oscillochloris sp.]|nr:YIP1 family protein [Oscillochloris sp.]